VIGIQARGLDGQERPHGTVEAMAADYVREVKARQPDGPYYLCGYSFGGLVVFEMARRLWESGDEVALVGLFDTMMSPVRWPLRSWLSLARQGIVRIAGGVSAAPIKSWPGAVGSIGRGVCESLRGLLTSAHPRVLKVAVSELIASARYRPGFYPGELTLFRAVGREPGLPSLESTWREHACTLSMVETAGGHMTMFSAIHAESVAASLTRRLLVCAEKNASFAASLHHRQPAASGIV
jgi:acetoacetyl-CoA synthetase